MTSDVPILIEVPQGHIADVITHLEMTNRPEIAIPDSSLEIIEWSRPSVDEYLDLFRAIGERWLWLSRLIMDAEELAAILHNDKNQVFKIIDGENSVGLLELDFKEAGQCEIGFFDLISSYNGKGHGS